MNEGQNLKIKEWLESKMDIREFMGTGHSRHILDYLVDPPFEDYEQLRLGMKYKVRIQEGESSRKYIALIYKNEEEMHRCKKVHE